MPGYLIWLNARLYEMKGLLKKTGSILMHCDWHASHYIKVEMDKIFGYYHLQNEVVWSYRSGGGSKKRYGRKHDVLLWYSKALNEHVFNSDDARVPYDAVIAESRRDMFNSRGKVVGSVWDISRPPNHSKEWIGYPTQKPEAVLDRVAALSTEHADYENFLTFVQPPKVEMGWKRIAARTYKFDVSETAILNAGAKIINVQWDFDYGERFSSTPGFSFIRSKKKEPALQTQYEFPGTGTISIACKVQDDMGGEGLWTGEIEVR